MKTAMVSVITMLPEGRMAPVAGEVATETTAMEEAATGDNNEGAYAE